MRGLLDRLVALLAGDRETGCPSCGASVTYRRESDEVRCRGCGVEFEARPQPSQNVQRSDMVVDNDEPPPDRRPAPVVSGPAEGVVLIFRHAKSKHPHTVAAGARRTSRDNRR